jgi:hypothetical protein
MKRDRQTPNGAMRECWTCQHEKLLGDFGRDMGICRECKRARQREYYWQGRLAIKPREIEGRPPDGMNAEFAIRMPDPTIERCSAGPLLEKLSRRAREQRRPITSLAKEAGISRSTMYRWKASENMTVNPRTVDMILGRMKWNPHEVWK